VLLIVLDYVNLRTSMDDAADVARVLNLLDIQRDGQGETVYSTTHLQGKIEAKVLLKPRFRVRKFLRPPCRVALRISSCLGTSKPMFQRVLLHMYLGFSQSALTL
jgi:hypothetical protein